MDSETLNSHPKSPASAPAPNSSKLVYNESPSQSPPSPPPHFDHRNRLQSMFSSQPTTAQSSTWLQRLRSSQGFPDSDHVDLEHFLSSSLEPQTSTDSALTDKRSQQDDNFTADKCDDGGVLERRDLINNVLSELFCMGDFRDKSRISRKKSCRKQQCPRICVVSNNLDVQNVSVQNDRVSSPSPLPLPSTFNSRRKVREVNQELQVMDERADDEEEKTHWDFSAYSQTEVMVIDTSVPSWKFEKTLYRRKNVWKAVDKKGKGLISGDRKKRKETVNDNGDVQKKKLKLCSLSSKSQESVVGSEKKKKKKKKLLLCSSSNYVNKEEDMVQSKSTQGHDQGKTMVADCVRKQDDCSLVQEKSFFKKQIEGGSSVILIKSIPTTSRKDVSGTSKGCVK